MVQAVNIMPRGHPAQLLVCHERIAATQCVHDSAGEQPRQWCSLAAYAWCYSCGYFVCDLHAEARHAACRTAVEYPANTSAEIFRQVTPR